MKYILSIVLCLQVVFSFAQQVKKDSTQVEYYIYEGDTLYLPMVELNEVVIGKESQQSIDDKKKFLLLRRRVLKVYPYAKSAADNLTMLNTNMAKLKTDKEKKKYFKIVEDYLENTFEGQLKKLSRKEGQVLVKLIHRQTGKSTFTLIKELKSGWKAFWSNNTAKLFDISLKTEYDPYIVNEDFLIETILVKAFSEGRLDKQPSFKSIDIDELTGLWNEKFEKAKNLKAEE
jgi:ABC-type transporter MlaC component